MTESDGSEGERRSDVEITLTERFKALFEHMQEGVALHELVCDEVGKPVNYRILDVNPQFEKHTGIRRASATGRLATEVYGTETPPYLEEFSSVALGEGSRQIETFFAALDRHFQISVAPLGPRAFATIFLDVTASKRQAEALEKTRLAQRALIDNQPQLTWLKDREGRFIVVNEAFSVACGQSSPDAMLGKTDLDVWPRELAEAYRADDEVVIRTGTQKVVEERIETSKGTRWVETYKSPVFAPDGSIVGTTGLARDITEQKRALEAIRQSEHKFQQVFDLAPNPIAVSALSGELLFVNQAFCNLTGRTRAEMIGSRTEELGIWESLDLRAKVMKRLERDGHFDSFEITMIGKGGSRRYMEMSGALIVIEGRQLMITAASDITERRIAEEQARVAARTLADFFGLSVDLLCVASASGTLLRINPAWEQVLGWSLAELEGTSYLELVHPDDIEATLGSMNRLREGSRIIDFQNRYRTKSGSW